MAGIEDKNLFMMCEALNPAALTQLSPAYYVRTCRTDELDVWKAYGHVSTIHWLKVSKRCEGLGIGRALISIVMNSFEDNDYPIFFHTRPGSLCAIKLYSDFGFVLLTDATLGYRQNVALFAGAYAPRGLSQITLCPCPK